MAEEQELSGEALVKETSRLIRLARSRWDAHENGACRVERDRALSLYVRCTPEDKKRIPQVLLVWLRYRSEKYFGEHRTKPGKK
ncbi:MAG: Precorrin-3B methylase [Spirochaetes bacterium GWB1_59_5]|nr:MAG: Precorrin-3B methylase [Spirochaetes bacterium GWB1_59_5]